MIRYENQCCDCATESYPCLGSNCPNRNVRILECDSCGEEADVLYIVENEELCRECALERLEKVE